MTEENKKPSNPDFHKGSIHPTWDRVTLRDHFAGLAMQGYMIGQNYTSIGTKEQVAKASYLMADEMLKQRGNEKSHRIEK